MNRTISKPLGAVCKVLNGRAYKQEELLPEGKYRVLRVGNFFSNGNWYYSDLELDEDKYCDKGDLLFAWSASFGPRIWDESKTIYHYHIWKLCEDQKVIDKQYLYYYLLNSVNGLMASTHGSIMLHLTKDFMEKLPISFPENLNTQKDISSVLSAIDQKIKTNNSIIDTLESIAKTLYEYWFVQFDFPNSEGKPYKSSGGEMTFNENLGFHIPDGWNVCELGEILSIKRGISYKSSEISSCGHPLINLNSFSLVGRFKHDGTKYFSGKFKQESLIPPGELVIAITDVTQNAEIIGKAFVVPNIFDCSPLISCDVAAIASPLGVAYTEQLFNSDSYHNYIKHFASGTLVLHLDLNGVKWFKTTVPPSYLIEKYEGYCQLLFSQRDVALKENVNLTSLRDLLLPMLMNGQIYIE